MRVRRRYRRSTIKTLIHGSERSRRMPVHRSLRWNRLMTSITRRHKRSGKIFSFTRLS
jgi:hypothetical protein